MGKIVFGAALIASLLPSVSFAAECKQERAIYADRDGAYELTFEAVDSDPGSTSYRFALSIRNSDTKLEGFVMGSEPVDRPNGIMFHNCPEGDVTGEDLAKCTVWEGVIYGNVGGKIALLPVTGAKAADEILLPGFAPALMESTAWGAGKVSTVPFDVFSYRECRP